MFELFASRLSRCFVALAFFFAAFAVFVSPASARPHHRHSAERHAYVHHASRHHHYRHSARSSRFERSAAALQAGGFANTQASYEPNANAGASMSSGFGGGSGLVSEARRYLGGNPTGRVSLWCARFMNMVLEKTGHRGTGSDMASSFARYGTRVSGPQVGAIAVMSRGGRGGHVGIITGIDARGNPIMISGNNGNRVREAPISRGRIYAYVMPN
ncbi:TIGR02594 family protein [Bradyrhizobium sp. GCM10027634]|uniref:TIGR02594 family protein n=1 Tax=unclassified Bradyrhizobium TaxID=2631580 RepID=UPI00188CAC42|nr:MULTISPECIES: TIGR02594 family protein [unclassified Bradyrhizobium]MDN5003456.1 TIGR02594 family protein [Bradyrhizobium sp. WYCCWR 12677]QOZ47981.1 TIGR02594 family protein [Bradyrhizobium sp. CCBAU 53340]